MKGNGKRHIRFNKGAAILIVLFIESVGCGFILGDWVMDNTSAKAPPVNDNPLISYGNLTAGQELLKVMSLSEAARFLKVPRNTLRDHLERAGVPFATSGNCRNTPGAKSPSDSNTNEGG